MAYEGQHPFPVKNGGTGNSSFSSFSVICAGTSSTGAFQHVSGQGTSLQVLTSNGASALPTWQNFSGGGGSSFAKAWATFTSDSSGNVNAILNSFNVSNIVYAPATNVTGYTVTLTNSFSTSNYVVIGSAVQLYAFNNGLTCGSTGLSRGSFEYLVFFDSSTLVYNYRMNFICYGT